MKKSLLLSGGLLSMLVLSACQPATPANTATNTGGQNVGVKVGKAPALAANSCDTLTPADLSAIVGIPAEQLAPSVSPLYEGVWTCSFGKNGEVSFTVTVSSSADKATSDMEEYRNNIETAAAVIPDGKYPQGAYSDISGVGEEAIYSAVNNSLNARKGAVSILVMSPNDKIKQVNVADAFFKKLQ